MGETLKLLAAGRDAAQLVQSLTWSGGYARVARTLDFSLACSEVDRALPTVDCPPGTPVRFYRNGALLFDGFVFSRQRDTLSNTVEISCADRGLYLKRSKASYKFRGQTPERIARRVAGDFNIPVGALAATGAPVSRSFPGVSLYKMIQTAYTLAAAATGERYLVRFKGEALEVVAKKQGADTRVIRPGVNLISLTATDSVEKMVNQVQVLDKNGTPRGAPVKDAGAIAAYGLFQETITENKNKSSAGEARRLLEDGALEQKITVQVLGDPAFLSGNCVVLQEPVTGLYGLCWIDEDTHIWKGGLYQCRLVLNFRSIMDEQEAGKLPG